MGYCHLISLFTILSLLSGCFGSSENTGYHPGPKGLRRRSDDDSSYCESWKFSVENGDAGQGLLVPSRCEKFVKNYMTGERYLSDSEFVANHSIAFAKSVTLAGDGLDCWIFDVDDTLLSTLPFLAKHGYGSKVPNVTLAYEWVSKAVAPALPQTLRLYNELKKLNFTLIVLTGRSEIYRAITQKNLLFAGYKHWHKLILREASAKGPYTATVFKSKKRQELEAQGYRIHGSSGDQWSDLLGNATAVRSFKLPNPMSKVPNVTLAYEWVSKAVAPALPQTLRLYNELKKLNFTLIVLTGRSEIYRAITQKNLLFAGYKHWHKLILREASAKGPYTATVFKSKKRQELEAQGYRIHGSSGDQWSDLLGNATAVRSFKLPNPMYTVA